jgi:hypothetical protein
MLLLSAVLVPGVLGSADIAPPTPLVCASPTRVPLEPVDYHFEIDEIALRARGRTQIRDAFDRAGSFGAPRPYFQNMGLLDGSDVSGGRLHMQQSCAVNPFENFACDFSVPVDDRGAYSFIGGDYFGDFEFSARLASPRAHGPEKFKLGLVDDQVFFSAATVSFEKDRVALERQGGDQRAITPFLETTFDEIDLTRFGDIDELELRLRVDAAGKPSAIVRVRAGSSVEVVQLMSDAPSARLNPRARYSVHVFTEDLAKPRIFSFYPESVSVGQLRTTAGVLDAKVFGIGFGKDARVEIVPERGGASTWALAPDILMFNMGVRAKVPLQSATPGTYAIRVHSSGSTASLERGLRVFE